jgi:NADPH:quinone reductase-like Zn-dependent oxidoreductase
LQQIAGSALGRAMGTIPLSAGGVIEMRAFTVDRAGAPGSLHDVEMPIVGAADLLVRIHAAGVNPMDWKVRDGTSGGRQAFPLIMGQDFAGEVAGAGANAGSFSVGDRVFGVTGGGSYAEYVTVNAAGPVAATPAALDDAHAAALPTAGLAALAALEALALRAGETLLVMGATGGVGGFAVQIARARGVRVLATAHSGKERVARAFGADEVLVYDHIDAIDSVKTSHPDGIDAVLDLVSDRSAVQRTATVLRSGGRLVSTVGAVDESWFAERGLGGRNISVSQTPQWSREGLEHLARLVEARLVTIRLDAEAPLADAERVLARSKAGDIIGKAVLMV